MANLQDHDYDVPPPTEAALKIPNYLIPPTPRSFFSSCLCYIIVELVRLVVELVRLIVELVHLVVELVRLIVELVRFGIFQWIFLEALRIFMKSCDGSSRTASTFGCP